MPITIGFVLVALLGACAGGGTITREEALKFGSFEVLRGQPNRQGVVFGAPHGTGDTNTGAIAKRLALELGVPAVIAHGFTKRETGDMRINVNRPTEGAGLYFNQEARTFRAGHVWEEYRRLLLEATKGELDLYIEFHCNEHPSTGGAIEIATTGISYDQAQRARRLYYQARDGVAAGRTMPKVEVKVEPVDRIYMVASGAKNHGSMALARRAIHIEIPVPTTRLALGEGPYAKVFDVFLRDLIALLQAR